MKNAILALVGFLSACNHSSSPPIPTVPVPPIPSWQLLFSDGVALNGTSFAFPLAPGHVNMMVGPGFPVTGKLSVTYEIVGDAVYDGNLGAGNTCPNSPAATSLYVQRAGDTMTGVGDYEFYRWWSKDAIVLAPGSFTLTVDVSPDKWVSVYGKDGTTNPALFDAAMASPGAVGMVFGGGCFKGHGVNLLVNLPAQFTMKSFGLL